MILGTGLLLSGTRRRQAQAAPMGPDVNDTFKTIRSLRTTHGNFTDQPIPEKHLDLILDATVRAANASNMQTYSIIVIKDRAKMKAVSGYQASCLLVYCVDHNRLKTCAKALGHPYFPDNINSFITSSTNTILAVQTAAIAARSLGIDYLITNGIHRGDMKRQWDLLDLPAEHCYPLIALLLGYPTEEPSVKKGRLTDTGIVHREKYQTLMPQQVDEVIAEYDDPDKHIALNDTWKNQGHKHYLDWLFTDWLRRSAKPTAKETQMLALLKRSGYVEPHQT
jgi:nitroreductase